MTATIERTWSAGEMLTPTGVVLDGHEPNSEEWREARRSGLGASDLSAVLNLSAYRSPAHVWAVKTGRLDGDDAGDMEAATWGHRLEPVVANVWAEDHPATAVFTVPALAHVDTDWHRASLDRVVTGCGAGCALEIKVRNNYTGGRWYAELPDDVLAQCQWQLHVTGLDHIHAVALIGGQRLKEHVVVPESELIGYLLDEAATFWQHVQDDTRPPVDSAALLLDLLDRLHPNRDGQVEVAADKAFTLRAEYQMAHRREKAAKTDKEAAKAALVDLLGNAHTACVEEVPIATYKPQMRRNVDYDALAAGYPDAYAACVFKKPTRPVLLWKGGTEEETSE